MARQKNDGMGRLGGRAKGTPNKITQEKRELIAKFIDDNWKTFMEDWKDMVDKEKKCQIMVSLLPFAVPKLATIEYKDKDRPRTFQDELDELAEIKKLSIQKQKKK